MNLSGIAVRRLADYFRIPIEDILVVHDDLDLPFPTIRLKQGGGHGGHKGLISIIDHLDGAYFTRIRIGIGRPARKSMVESYVLAPFSDEELTRLPQLIRPAGEVVADILSSGVQASMDKYHGKETINFFKEG